MTSEHIESCDYTYVHASGPSFKDCWVLGLRFEHDQAFSPHECESWAIRIGPDDTGRVLTTLDFGMPAWWTGLWMSPSGMVYVSDASGRLFSRPPGPLVGPAGWSTTPLDATLAGIWGLDDRCVITWGRRGDRDLMWRWDGALWSPMPSPGDVAVMHGIRPDLILAAGYDGLVSIWDGRAWTTHDDVTANNVTSVFVAGPDAYWAVTEAGQLLAGNARGWTERARTESRNTGVALFGGALWVANADEGLMKLDAATDRLIAVKPDLLPRSFDTRGALLVTCKEMIVETHDGQSFRAMAREVLRGLRETQPRMWMA